jgi:hypothetical protein
MQTAAPSNTICILPSEVRKEGKRSKVDVRVDIRPALRQWESPRYVRAVPKMATLSSLEAESIGECHQF